MEWPITQEGMEFLETVLVLATIASALFVINLRGILAKVLGLNL